MMQSKFFLTLFSAAALFVANTAGAQTITVKLATTRDMVPKAASATDHDGHDHGKTRKDIRFTIVWNSGTAPSAIFYRADAAHWLKCKATRSERRPFGGGPSDFVVVENRIPVTDIKKGESINLKPEEIPSEVQPDEVKKLAAGALFYQISGSAKWYVQKVKLTKLPDAAL